MTGVLEYRDIGLISDDQNLYLQASREVERWFLMGSPWPVLIIVSAYLLFVLRVGPEFMKNRKPFNIKYIMLTYNLYQTISNAYIVSKLFTTKGAINYLWKHGCHPMDPALNPFWTALNNSAWLYFFSKVMDLLDTIFFVLRKKQSHITFLHVYHHANMVLSTWAYLKYIKGEQGVVVGVVNSSVHVVMYGYYFLSALGPEIQKYLWWKKYITRMQMIQFVIIIVYMATLLIAKCQLPKSFSLYIIFQGVIFFVLFANFYIQTYITNGNKTKSQSPAKNQSTQNGGIPHGAVANESVNYKMPNGVCHSETAKLKAN